MERYLKLFRGEVSIFEMDRLHKLEGVEFVVADGKVKEIIF